MGTFRPPSSVSPPDPTPSTLSSHCAFSFVPAPSDEALFLFSKASLQAQAKRKTIFFLFLGQYFATEKKSCFEEGPSRIILAGNMTEVLKEETRNLSTERDQ